MIVMNDDSSQDRVYAVIYLDFLQIVNYYFSETLGNAIYLRGKIKCTFKK